MRSARPARSCATCKRAPGVGYLLGVGLFTILPAVIEIGTVLGIIAVNFTIEFTWTIAATLVSYASIRSSSRAAERERSAATLPAIALTGRTDAATRERTARAGFSAHLV